MQEGQRDFLGKRHVDLPDTPVEAADGLEVSKRYVDLLLKYGFLDSHVVSRLS